MYRDLSQPIETGMQRFPGDPEVSVEPVATADSEGYRVSAIDCGTHTGTHVDAPSHVGLEGAIDGFDVGRFVVNARVVDCTGLDPREPIEPSALPDDDGGEMVLVRTGWDDHWGSPRYLDHPYLTAGAADRCVAAGWSVGLDTLSPDPTPSENAAPGEPEGVPAHRRLLGNGRFVVENLRNLGGLGRCRLFAVPLPIAEGDGSPVRAFARERPQEADAQPR
ncbi:cyclase family protein [Natronomonas moolapensis 8.8.11]|uniref:Cyclase family protein n=1 Tax=Natronomonas moolapensis (strain DSM 18674 / CECT 7526 / JCM 14361 / 8.8.11) TaxID=268739 RepID=M1XLF1_NATM8|nr:cyclase family protein [Natronomonas moolapensis]CCQ37604.1 cyclase family protein [Natronomonas moolapensis 8.8.11]